MYLISLFLNDLLWPNQKDISRKIEKKLFSNNQERTRGYFWLHICRISTLSIYKISTLSCALWQSHYRSVPKPRWFPLPCFLDMKYLDFWDSHFDRLDIFIVMYIIVHTWYIFVHINWINHSQHQNYIAPFFSIHTFNWITKVSLAQETSFLSFN